MEADVTLLQEFLERSARRHPDKVALLCGEERMTYGAIDGQASRLAATLARCGVERGDRVIIYAPNSTEAAVSFWGVLKAGAVVSLVNASTKPDKLAWYVNNCRAKALVTTKSLLSVVTRVLPRCSCVAALILSAPLADHAAIAGWGGRVVAWEEAIAADGAPPRRRPLDVDLASIIYTSGSTGSPKGVMMTHLNMRTAAASISGYLALREDEVILGALPLSFDYGLYQMIMAFRAGARLVLELSFSLIGEVLQRVVDERVTCFPGVPTMFSMMGDFRELGRFDLSGVRLVTNTAAALSPRHIEFLHKTFPAARIYSMYGLTECKRCTYLPPEDLVRKPLSVGIAIPNTELWIVDEQDRKLGPGQVGQLVIRGATVMRGYWENPEATARKLRPGPLPGEQVLYTGDYCRLDDEGYLYFVGRMDDIIKSRGEKVSPKEVETVISALAGVRDVAVIGVDDEVLGQAVKAFVVLNQGATLRDREILAHCTKHLENFAVPKHVAIVPELAKSPSGKIVKTNLR